MVQKTVVITGGTAGIGQQTAIALARLGLRVMVTGRDPQRSQAGLRAIQEASGSCQVELVLGDLAQHASLHELAAQLRERAPCLDVLINNAGAFWSTLQHTQEGLEMCIAMNVAAPYLLTRALIPVLETAHPARVINVTGGTLHSAFDVDNLQAQKGYSGLLTYSHSKRAADAMSMALAAQLAPRGIFLNVVYPGQAATGMTQSVTPQSLPWWMRPLWPLFSWVVAPDGGKSAAKASRSSVWAATHPSLEGVAGKYFTKNCKPGRLHPSVHLPTNQQRVLACISGAANV